MPFPLIPLLLSAASTAGGALLGRSERPTIDPEMMRMLFGPDALSKDTSELFRFLLNSPEFSSMLRNASAQGTSVANATRANMAKTGILRSPMGAFLSAAGSQYGNTFANAARSRLFEQALTTAFQNLNQRASIWGGSQLQRQAQPTWERMLGSSLLGAGAQGFMNLDFSKPAAAQTAQAAPPVGSRLAMPYWAPSDALAPPETVLRDPSQLFR